MFLGFLTIPCGKQPPEIVYLAKAQIRAFCPSDNGKGVRVTCVDPDADDLVSDLSLQEIERKIRAAQCDGRIFLTLVRESTADPAQLPLPLSPPVDDQGRND
jgi:hypothetical protein